jgi:hypothetical protein
MQITVYAVLVFDDSVELHPKLYKSYETARESALEKYKEWLDEERAEVAEYGGRMASQVDVEENQSGETKLYVEKEVYITIQRYVYTIE